MTLVPVQTERERRQELRRKRAHHNLEKASTYQAMALRRQSLALAKVPYHDLLKDPETEFSPVAGCAACAAGAEHLRRLEKALKRYGTVETLAKAVQQTGKAVSDTMRLQDFLKGLPDSRTENTTISIGVMLQILNNEEYAIVEKIFEAAQLRAKVGPAMLPAGRTAGAR